MQCSRHQELLIFAKPTGPALGVRRCLPAPHTDRSAGRSGSLSPVRTGKQRTECHHLIPAASPRSTALAQTPAEAIAKPHASLQRLCQVTGKRVPEPILRSVTTAVGEGADLRGNVKHVE